MVLQFGKCSLVFFFAGSIVGSSIKDFAGNVVAHPANVNAA